MLRKSLDIFTCILHPVQFNFCSLSEEELQGEVVVVVLVERRGSQRRKELGKEQSR